MEAGGVEPPALHAQRVRAGTFPRPHRCYGQRLNLTVELLAFFICFQHLKNYNIIIMSSQVEKRLTNNIFMIA